MADAGLSDVAEGRSSRCPAPPASPIHFDVGDILLPATAGSTPGEQLRREAIAWAYFLALIVGVILFGFHIAVPVFLVLFLRFRAETSWKLAHRQHSAGELRAVLRLRICAAHLAASGLHHRPDHGR